MASLLRGSAFITGAARGIGQATATAFARHGITRLAIADVDKDMLASSHASLKKEFPKIEILPLTMDVRNRNEVRASVSEVARAFGRLDVAVNVAGVGGSNRRTHEIDDEEIERVLDINLHGVYRCQKEELKTMVGQEDLGAKEGRGRIINVASMYGLVAPNQYLAATAYTTSKHAVIGLTKADANSYAKYNIRLNAISPGYVETPLIARMAEFPDTPLAQDLKRTPVQQRLAAPEEIADAIVWLASPMNSYMQGSVMVVDGGFTSN